MKYSVIFAALLALLVQGCSTMDNGVKAHILGANIDIAKERAQAAAKPVLNASIPVQGCNAPEGTDYKTACVMTSIVHAPQGAANSGQIAMPDDPWARAADRAVGVLGTAAGLYLGGQAAVGLVDAAAGGIAKALQTMPDPVVVPPATPVIVPAADPVIVQPVVVPAPDPVIVDPVVVQPEIVYVPAAP